MWLAVCSDNDCGWEHASVYRRYVEAHWQWHVLETGHHGAVVDIPSRDPEHLTKPTRVAPKVAA